LQPGEVLFGTASHGIGEGWEQIDCNECTRQPNKSSNALPNKIIIKCQHTLEMIERYYKGVGTINFRNGVHVSTTTRVHSEHATSSPRIGGGGLIQGIFGTICIDASLFHRLILFANRNKKGSHQEVSLAVITGKGLLTTHCGEFAQ
jgi:hypothetical protein